MSLIQPPLSSSSTIIYAAKTMLPGHGGRAIDRHNPHLQDERRQKPVVTTFASKHQMTPSSSSSSSQPPPPTKPQSGKQYNHKKGKTASKIRRERTNFSPPGSSRYLLSETVSSDDVITKFEPLPSSSLPVQPSTTSLLSVNSDEYPFIPPPSTTSTTCTTDHQVVSLRVSLHCKGCEGKVRKHISKMKGVTSFTIDFAMKKVTVVGDVTPLGVLANISKVKHAKFWPSSSSSTPLKSTC